MESSPAFATVKNGKLSGITLPCGVRVFRGIPFAQPPVGPLRFQRPQPPQDWEGILDATKYRNIPPQEKPDGLYGKEFSSHIDFPDGNEDCLYLNVHCPPESMCNNGLLPVVVWIHGGSYCSGLSWGEAFDTEEYAKRGIVYVTIEYRLGPFGFLVHPFAGEGNYGIYDMIQALKWVQENISAFNGDKNRVTIWGQSAGAMAIQKLIESPLTDGLFSQIIQQSGGGYMNNSLLNQTKKEMQKKSQKIIDKLGVKSKEELFAKTTDEIMDAYFATTQPLELGPYIDGELTKGKLHELIESKEYRNVPTIIGSLSKEFGLGTARFIFYRMMLNQCRAQIKNGYIPCYMYYGDISPPGDDNIGATHSFELWYTFGTYEKSPRPMGEKDEKLSKLFIDYWSNFIKTGNPNGEGLPEWKQYTNDNKKHLYISHDGAHMEDAHWF